MDGVFVNFCLCFWVEAIDSPRARPILGDLATPSAYQLNLSIEQINFSMHGYPKVEGLNGEDLEQLADIIRYTSQQYLNYLVETKKKHEERYGRRAALVFGKLQEHWQEPRPALVEFHQTIFDYARSFTLERTNTPLLERYVLDEESSPIEVHLADDPDVMITTLFVDRDNPKYSRGIVRLGLLEIPIDVYDVGPFRLPHPVNDPSGKTIESVSLNIIVHPFSLRIRPERQLHAGIDAELATAAANHMRNGLMKRDNRNMRDSSTRIDFIVV